MSRRVRGLVLCYHAVSEEWEHALAVRAADFEQQLRRMIGRGYRPATAAEVVRSDGRLLHVTFDDAYRSVEHALPALGRLGIPATVFVCTEYAESGSPLSIPELAEEAARLPTELATLDWPAVRELGSRGVEVGSHTVTHAHLPTVSDAELTRELQESKQRLETEVGSPCRFLAYPYGEHDARVREAARKAGYEAAFALPGREAPLDPFAFPRVGIWRKDGAVRTALKSSAVARRAIGRIRRWA
jgi:peptidoglycan/xylan/chitin deacetylase (PgdA/CDA1 family)